MASGPTPRALLLRLQKELKTLADGSYTGILCVPREDCIQKWDIYMQGPLETPYEQGIFHLEMGFPEDYPNSPPSLRFLSSFWHPNVYPDGRICISILHAPVIDPMNTQEELGEKWRPVQNAGTVLLSVQSMLSDPNTESPANVDASVQWRNNRPAFAQRCESLSVASYDATPASVREQLAQSKATHVFQPEHSMFNDLFAEPEADLSAFDFHQSLEGDDFGADADWGSTDALQDSWDAEPEDTSVACASSDTSAAPSESSSSGTEPQEIQMSSSSIPSSPSSPSQSRKRSAHPV